jgi:hypothetical protein
MAEYKSIKGFKVQTVSTDPAVSNLGQVFYNSTADAFKVTQAINTCWYLGFWWKFKYSKKSISWFRNSNSSFR